jgi:SAM-dependent methyltransferase
LLWLYLGEHIHGPVRVLHFAPERCIEQNLRAMPNVEYLSADLLDPRADVKTDITDLDFRDSSFDLVLCSHVLEHVPDDRAAMKEIRRVLVPGGTAIIQSPVNYDQPGTFEDPTVTDPEERLRLFSQRDHVRVYGPDLLDRLRDTGFDVTVVDAEAFPARKYGLRVDAGPLRNDLYVASPKAAV